jgi:hypothetical protein
MSQFGDAEESPPPMHNPLAPHIHSIPRSPKHSSPFAPPASTRLADASNQQVAQIDAVIEESRRNGEATKRRITAGVMDMLEDMRSMDTGTEMTWRVGECDGVDRTTDPTDMSCLRPKPTVNWECSRGPGVMSP